MTTRYLLPLLLCLLFSTAFTSSEKAPAPRAEIEWLEYEEARQRMQKEPRKILLDVYTTWCYWCKVMDSTTFKDETVTAYVNQHFYAVKLHAESYRELNFKGEKVSEYQLSRDLGVASFPTIVLLDEQLENPENIEGYRKPGNFMRQLEKFVQQNSASARKP